MLLHLSVGLFKTQFRISLNNSFDLLSSSPPSSSFSLLHPLPPFHCAYTYEARKQERDLMQKPENKASILVYYYAEISKLYIIAILV